MYKHNDLVQYGKQNISYSISKFVYFLFDKPSLPSEVIYLCDSCLMVFQCLYTVFLKYIFIFYLLMGAIFHVETKKITNQIWDIIWFFFLSLIFFPIGFIFNNFSMPYIFNQNSFSFYFLWDISVSIEFWKSYLMKEIIIWISSLTSCLALIFFLNTFKSYITLFVWWILEILDNYWKKRIWMLSDGLFWYKLRTIFCLILTLLSFFCDSL